MPDLQKKIKVVLMQGPVLLEGSTKIFEDCLKKTLTSIGTAESINVLVSTWEPDLEIRHRFKETYPFVKFVYSSCPKALEFDFQGNNIVCNVNRLIKSTLYGLNNISNDAVVLKIRTDSYLLNLNAFVLFEQALNDKHFRNPKYEVYENFILNLNLFIRNPVSHMPFLYHFGDISMVGICSDLKKIFDIPPAKKNIFKVTKSIRIRTNYALVAEQYILLNSLKINLTEKNKVINFKENFLFDSDEIDVSNQYLINNFIFYNSTELGIRWPKYGKKYLYKGWSSLFDYNDWKNMQNKYNSTQFIVHKKRLLIKCIFYNMTRVYFYCRNFLLSNNFIFKIAYKLFARR